MKNLVLFAMWLVASLAAVGVAWAGVSVVDDQIVDPPSVGPVAAPATVGASLGDDAGGNVDLGETSTTTRRPFDLAETAEPATTTSESAEGETPATAADSGSPASSAPSSSATTILSTTSTTQAPATQRSPSTQGSPATQGSTATSNTTTSTVAVSQTTSTTTQSTTSTTTQTTTTQTTTTKTFSTVGGSAAISFSANNVRVLWATPNPGFEVEIDVDGPTDIRVEFESDDHRSRIDAWWSGGAQHRIREDDDR